MSKQPNEFVQGLTDIWRGVTGTVAGVGANVQATANERNAAAANIAANEAAEQRILATAAARERQLMFVFVAIAFIAIALPLAIYASKK